jgi:hypothetical protein
MKRCPCKTPAFSLVEVTFALGICAFCLIAIFGLLPVGLKSNQMAMEQTAANDLISMVAADLRATPPTSPPGGAACTQQFGIPIPANPVAASGVPDPFALYFTSSGQCLQNASDAAARYRLTLRFLPNGTAARGATFVTLQVSWPPSVDPSQAVGSCQTFLALDRN